MFFYRPSKDMCWGHALRPKDPAWRVAKQRLEVFLDTYFERVEQDDQAKFGVVVRIGKKGTLADRKPDAEIAKRLNDALAHAN